MSAAAARLAVLAVLLTGCASTSLSAAPRLDSPPQKGTALIGWIFYVGAGGHTAFEGATSRGLCETLRGKELENTPHLKPTPCLPVKMTAD